MSTQPTDDDIVALADATRTAEGGANGYILPISFARAVLAKWGTPATGGEPVACNCKATDMRLGVCCKVRAAFEEWYDQQQDGCIQPFDVWLAAWRGGRKSVGTSPQPVREPLDAAALSQRAKVGAIQTDNNDNVVLRRAEYRSQMEGRFERAWREAEKYHGITGGQHGTER